MNAMCGAGLRSTVKGLSALQYNLSADTFQPCSAAHAERCAYPDFYMGAFNASLTYACPSLLSLPHFLQVSPSFSHAHHAPKLLHSLPPGLCCYR